MEKFGDKKHRFYQTTSFPDKFVGWIRSFGVETKIYIYGSVSEKMKSGVYI